MDYIFNLLMSKIVKAKTNVKIGGASALVFGIEWYGKIKLF